MNISFFGSSLVSSYWNGAATYYRGLLKEIAALGHAITSTRRSAGSFRPSSSSTSRSARMETSS